MISKQIILSHGHSTKVQALRTPLPTMFKCLIYLCTTYINKKEKGEEARYIWIWDGGGP